MTTLTNIHPHIIESLYCEALVLADETRAAFDMTQRPDDAGDDEDLTRIAMSCEALRTTTRMMQALAWLLNQRAFMKGEISETQLRRHGRLPPRPARSDPEQLALIDPDTCDLIAQSERLYERIARLDETWELQPEPEPNVIGQLHERLTRQAAGI